MNRTAIQGLMRTKQKESAHLGTSSKCFEPMPVLVEVPREFRPPVKRLKGLAASSEEYPINPSENRAYMLSLFWIEVDGAS